PPMAYPCYLGVDTAPIEQLIAANLSVPEIREHIGADSLGYLSIDGLMEAIGLPESMFCNACFHGRYPLPIETDQGKSVLERSGGEEPGVRRRPPPRPTPHQHGAPRLRRIPLSLRWRGRADTRPPLATAVGRGWGWSLARTRFRTARPTPRLASTSRRA